MFKKFCDFIQGDATVFLTNGVKLSGVITHTDSECLAMFRDGVTQLVMRHAIATIMPSKGFKIGEVK